MRLEEIFSFENLAAAHKMCRKGKQHKRGTIMFELELGRNLARLAEEFARRTYKIGKYRPFTIYDPKKRLIEALPYRDRVVLMCFCRKVLEPCLERKLVYDNAASRVGKGSGFAVSRLHSFMKKLHINNCGQAIYFLKCDVAKYFQSINHDILLEKLKKCGFSEDEMWFMKLVIDSHGSCGLPLGNQTSQWFALLYLDAVDRLIKEQLRVKYYVRYMDDFVLLSADKTFLQKCREEIEEFCAEELNLRLNDKTQIGMLKNGVDFLGFNHKLTAGGKIVKSQRAAARKRQRSYLKTIAYHYLAGNIDDDYVDVRRNAFRAHLSGTPQRKFAEQKIAVLKRKKRQKLK